MHVWDHISRSSDKSYVDSLPAAHGGPTRYREDMFAQYDGTTFTGVTKAGADATNGVFGWTGVEDKAADLRPDVNTGATDQRIYVPLDFSFSSAYGLALPVIALQYRELHFVIRIIYTLLANFRFLYARGASFIFISIV